jgi:hypothetical protein
MIDDVIEVSTSHPVLFCSTLSWALQWEVDSAEFTLGVWNLENF